MYTTRTPLARAGASSVRRAQHPFAAAAGRLTARRPCRRACGRAGLRPSRSIAHRNAASVLPEPVGADSKHVLAAGDRRPCLRLGGGRLGKGSLEPSACRGTEGGQGIDLGGSWA